MTDTQAFKVGDIVEFHQEGSSVAGATNRQFVRGEIVALVDIPIGGQPPATHAIVKANSGALYVKSTNEIERYRKTRAEVLFNAYCVMFRDFGGKLPRWGDIEPRDMRLLEGLAGNVMRELNSISGETK